MGRSGTKSELPKQDNDKSRKPKGKPVEDDDCEDGDDDAGLHHDG